MRKNVSGQVIGAQLVDASDGSAITSGTVTVHVTGDGGTQSTGSGTVTHEGNGFWSYAPTQAETNFDHVAFTFTHTSAIPSTVQVYPVAYDPTDATALGLARLDAAVSTRSSHAAADAADSVWDEAIADHVAAGSFGEEVQAHAQPGDEMNLVDAAITAAKFAAAALDAAALATDAGQEIADRLLNRNIGTGSDAGRTVQDALRLLRNRTEIASGTLTVYEEDDTTSAWDGAVTTAAGDPISEVDPT